jgi:hypothetical protein
MEYWVIQLLTENILVRKNIKRHLNDQQDVILAILLKKKSEHFTKIEDSLNQICHILLSILASCLF